MEYTLPSHDVKRLRGLAQKQKEISELPVMEMRRKIWTDMNNCVSGARPPIALENGTFNRDFMPPEIFECTSEYGRKLEGQMLENIRRHEILNDDHVCPGSLSIAWHIQRDEFGVEIPVSYEKDSEGIVTGYHFDCPVKDLETDSIDFLKPSTFELDREGTIREKETLEEFFGDILPVVVENGNYCSGPLTQRLMRLMSMETFFLGMYIAPEKLHAVMRYLTDNAKSYALWAERENILVPNHRNQCSCGTCYNFTGLLPQKDFDPKHVRLRDLWGVTDSQETVGVSPEFFAEFCLPYYQEFAELFGLLYFGCCEPVDPIWESISKLPNLHAVSISRWADQEKMGEYLHGRGIVYSRKPDPNFLSVDVTLNEDGWRNEIRKTLEVVVRQQLPAELIVRDVYTLHGNLNNAVSAVRIAREVIDEYY